MNATGGIVDGLLPLLNRVVRVLLWRASPRHVFGHHCSRYVVTQFVVLGTGHDTRIIHIKSTVTAGVVSQGLGIVVRFWVPGVWSALEVYLESSGQEIAISPVCRAANNSLGGLGHPAAAP